MKALVFDRYGKADDVLEIRDIPEPQPGPGEVKVKMIHSPMNPSDIINTVEGAYRDAVAKAIWNVGKPEHALTMDPLGERGLPSLPHVPGLEGVGVVVEAGAGLYPRLLLGKRVAVVGGKRGNWQQFNVIDARQALPVRRGISDEQAAVSFVNPVTAYAMIHEVLQCRRGDVLLQSAGNSEVGKMVARMGREAGYQTISIVRNKEQAEHLRALGAHHVIDITTENLRERVFQITQGAGVRYALDPIAGALASEMVQCLGLNGKLLVYGTLSGEPLGFSSRDLMTPLASLEGFFLSNWMASKSLIAKLKLTRKVAALVERGILQSDIQRIFPLSDFRAALEVLRTPGNAGKVLLQLNDPV